MEKLNMQTTSIVDENIRRIGELFPNCLTEVKDEKGRPKVAIDFDLLRQELSRDIVEGPEERYQFTWPDKRNAIRLANAPTTDTLRPVRSESVDFDNTQNLYIEGDNLQVLKLLRENYLGKVKMIYIDPPYNTGNDFVYNDNFDQDKQEYVHNSGQYDEEGNQLVANTESNGRFHTDWLNMIYPRLKVAKDLLSEDGVIFISIDDNEVENLKKICNQILGNSNLAGFFIKPLSGGKSPYFIKRSHEYLLCYTKNYLMEENALNNRTEILQESTSRSLRKDGDADRRSDRPDMYYCIFADINTGQLSLESFPNAIKIFPIRPDGSDGRWRWSKNKFNVEKNKLILKQKKDGSWDVHVISEEGTARGYPWESIIRQNTASGGSHLTELLGDNTIFSYPKNVDFIKWIISLHKDKKGVFLDFFSGSATTAHAVMQLNAEDGGKRKFIMVQLPEKTDEKSEAYKAGYKNICEIGKERIRRAGKKIKEESPLTTQDLDTGFRVLKLDSSNMQDVYYTPADFNEGDLFEDNIKPDRTEEDLLFQAMIELGIPLSAKIEQQQIAGKMVWNVSDGYLMACFDEAVNETTITEIARQQPYYFVMRDKSLASDNVADNFEQIFCHYSKDTIRRIL